jgi:hypothetical protein
MRGLALIFLWLFVGCGMASAAGTPVVFEGEGLLILHDGSTTAFNPHRDSGRRLLLQERESCCVTIPPNWHGPQDEFNFQGNEERHLPHASMRFVLNPHTGAFVSTTSLQNPRYPVTDPRRYVDGDITPMVALSSAQASACDCKLGDRVEILNTKTGEKVWAVYGNDAGPQAQGLAYLQISAAAAAVLNIQLDPDYKEPRLRNVRLQLRIYPGSGYGSHFPNGGVAPVKNAA